MKNSQFEALPAHVASTCLMLWEQRMQLVKASAITILKTLAASEKKRTILVVPTMPGPSLQPQHVHLHKALGTAPQSGFHMRCN